MPGERSFLSRFLAVVVPTKTQAMVAFFLALALSLAATSRTLLLKLGFRPDFLSASETQFHERFDAILRSGVASQIALITFWAIIGLFAYLLCWGAYNILVEARNEVTLNTAYTNRGHWRGAYETLALKAVAAVGLAGVISSLWPGISLWIALFTQFINDLTPANGGLAALAVLGFALQLYLCLALLQLTFTPWYRAQSFTDS